MYGCCILTMIYIPLSLLVSPAAVSPVKLIRTASHFNPAFHGYSQQDSMDFFRLILDRLHEELKYAVPTSALIEDSANNRKMRRKSGRLASKNNGNGEDVDEKVVYKSVVSDTFGGILRSEVQCHKCNKVTEIKVGLDLIHNSFRCL